MATFSQKMTGGLFSQPVSSDNPKALLAWEETGVTFSQDEALLLEELTDKTPLEGCVKLGAEKRKARLWGHHEHSSNFIDRIREERTD